MNTILHKYFHTIPWVYCPFTAAHSETPSFESVLLLCLFLKSSIFSLEWDMFFHICYFLTPHHQILVSLYQKKKTLTITSFILIKPVFLRTCSPWYLNWVWANAEAPELLGPPHSWLRLCFLLATLTIPAAGEFSGYVMIKHMGHRDADARTFEKKNEALWRLK